MTYTRVVEVFSYDAGNGIEIKINEAISRESKVGGVFLYSHSLTHNSSHTTQGTFPSALSSGVPVIGITDIHIHARSTLVLFFQNNL